MILNMVFTKLCAKLVFMIKVLSIKMDFKVDQSVVKQNGFCPADPYETETETDHLD